MVNLYYFVFCKISHRSTNFLNTSSGSSVNCSNILLKSLFFCVADCINILSSCSIKTKFSLFSTFNLSRRSVGKVTTLLFPTFLIFLRSEEHTSELQSRFDLVCRLLLEKENKLD